MCDSSNSPVRANWINKLGNQFSSPELELLTSSNSVNRTIQQFRLTSTELVTNSGLHELDCSNSSVHMFELANYTGFGLVFSSWPTVLNGLSCSKSSVQWTELFINFSSNEMNWWSTPVQINWTRLNSSSSTSWYGTVTHLVFGQCDEEETSNAPYLPPIIIQSSWEILSTPKKLGKRS